MCGYSDQQCCVKDVSSILYSIIKAPISRNEPGRTHTHSHTHTHTHNAKTTQVLPVYCSKDIAVVANRLQQYANQINHKMKNGSHKHLDVPKPKSKHFLQRKYNNIKKTQTTSRLLYWRFSIQ